MTHPEMPGGLWSRPEMGRLFQSFADGKASGPIWSASHEGHGDQERAATTSAQRWAQHLAHIALTQPLPVPAIVRNPMSAMQGMSEMQQ